MFNFLQIAKKCRAEFNNKRMTATSDKCRKHRFKFFSSFEFELEFEFEFVLYFTVFCQRVMLSIDSLCYMMKKKNKKKKGFVVLWCNVDNKCVLNLISSSTFNFAYLHNNTIKTSIQIRALAV